MKSEGRGGGRGGVVVSGMDMRGFWSVALLGRERAVSKARGAGSNGTWGQGNWVAGIFCVEIDWTVVLRRVGDEVVA